MQSSNKEIDQEIIEAIKDVVTEVIVDRRKRGSSFGLWHLFAVLLAGPDMDGRCLLERVAVALLNVDLWRATTS